MQLRKYFLSCDVKIETDATFSCQAQDVVNTRFRALAVNYMFFVVVVVVVCFTGSDLFIYFHDLAMTGHSMAVNYNSQS